MTRPRHIFLALALNAVLLSPGSALAFGLTPISQVLTPSGSGARCSYVVENPSEEPIAIEFFVSHLVKHLDGSEDLSQREEEDFAVFPPQLVLPPGASRTIRVRWLGDPEPESELAFRFMAEQIPVVIEEPTAVDDGMVHASVRFHYQFHGTLFVRPRGAKPDVDVEDIELVHGTESPALRIRVHNTGTARGWIRQFELRLVIGDEVWVLTENDLPALENLPVLAGGHREVTVAWPTMLPPRQPASASMSVVY